MESSPGQSYKHDNIIINSAGGYSTVLYKYYSSSNITATHNNTDFMIIPVCYWDSEQVNAM